MEYSKSNIFVLFGNFCCPVMGYQNEKDFKFVLLKRIFSRIEQFDDCAKLLLSEFWKEKERWYSFEISSKKISMQIWKEYY